jgi:hypothetical protein
MKINITFYILLALSSLFVIQSSYELFILTPIRGPQNIFYSAFHTWPGWLLVLFIISWIAYYLYLIFSIVALLMKRFLKKHKNIAYPKLLINSFYILLIHLIFVVTYKYWAVALFTEE